MAGFDHATGEVHDGPPRREVRVAQRRACALTRADLVVRIDADTVIGEWSLHYTARWFEDPLIGLVEPMCFPRATPRRSVFPYLRLFEELKQFGLNHHTIQTVDGVNVVPGVFTAFRRSIGIELGGFTVGMNGEDGDFTLRASRLGYRTWMDTDIVVYEDVPADLSRDPRAAGAVGSGRPPQPGPSRPLPGRGRHPQGVVQPDPAVREVGVRPGPPAPAPLPPADRRLRGHRAQRRSSSSSAATCWPRSSS